jgi:hypothetical protein
VSNRGVCCCSLYVSRTRSIGLWGENQRLELGGTLCVLIFGNKESIGLWGESVLLNAMESLIMSGSHLHKV